MSLIPQPSLGGKKLPVSIDFAAIGWGQHLAKRLVRFGEGRKGESPSWEGRGGNITPGGAGAPITDRSYWEGRFALCSLTLENGEGEQLVFPDAVAAVTRERRIVSTEITGRDGTVKEYINDGDWQINIVVGLQPIRGGEIVDEWPEEELRDLYTFLSEKDSLRVHSAFLDVFEITRIVIKSYSAAQMTETNYQEISISAVSDEEINLFSKEY